MQRFCAWSSAEVMPRSFEGGCAISQGKCPEAQGGVGVEIRQPVRLNLLELD